MQQELRPIKVDVCRSNGWQQFEMVLPAEVWAMSPTERGDWLVKQFPGTRALVWTDGHFPKS